MRRSLHLVLILVAAGASVGTSNYTLEYKLPGRSWSDTATLTHGERLEAGERWTGEIRFSVRPPERGQMRGQVTFSLDPVVEFDDRIRLRVVDFSGHELGLVKARSNSVGSDLVLEAFDDCEVGRPCRAAFRVVMENVRGDSSSRLTVFAEVAQQGGRDHGGEGQAIEATLVDLGISGGNDDTAEDIDTAETIDPGDSADTGAQ